MVLIFGVTTTTPQTIFNVQSDKNEIKEQILEYKEYFNLEEIILNDLSIGLEEKMEFIHIVSEEVLNVWEIFNILFNLTFRVNEIKKMKIDEILFWFCQNSCSKQNIISRTDFWIKSSTPPKMFIKILFRIAYYFYSFQNFISK